jgi:hypothetical protein
MTLRHAVGRRLSMTLPASDHLEDLVRSAGLRDLAGSFLIAYATDLAGRDTDHPD